MSTDTMFTDLEAQLRADLPRLAEMLMSTEPAFDESDESLLISLDRPSPRSRAWLVAAAAVAVVVVVLVGVVVALRADERKAARPVDVGPAPIEGSVVPMAASPLRSREAAVSVWTGSEVIIWGGRVGNLALSDGAAYDPSTDTWRAIASNSWGHPEAHAVWTGDEMVVLAKTGGAAYDPVTDRWRDLPRVERNSSLIAPVWTGHDLVAIGVEVGAADSTSLSAWTLAEGGESWRRDGSLDIGGSVFANQPAYQVAWTGSEAVAWNTPGNEGWAFDPVSRSWRTLPRLQPVEGSTASFPVVMDQGLGLVAWDLNPVPTRPAGITLLRPGSDGWEAVGNGMAGILDGGAVAVGAGGSVVVLGAGAPPRSVDASTGDWTSIDPDRLVPEGSNQSVIWTGEQLVIWGGTDSVGRPMAAGIVLTPDLSR